MSWEIWTQMNEIVSNLNTGSLALLFEVYVIFNFIYWLNSFLIDLIAWIYPHITNYFRIIEKPDWSHFFLSTCWMCSETRLVVHSWVWNCYVWGVRIHSGVSTCWQTLSRNAAALHLSVIPTENTATRPAFVGTTLQRPLQSPQVRTSGVIFARTLLNLYTPATSSDSVPSGRPVLLPRWPIRGL